MRKGLGLREKMANLKNSKEFIEESLINVKKECSMIEFVTLKVHLTCNRENRWEGAKLTAQYKRQ